MILSFYFDLNDLRKFFIFWHVCQNDYDSELPFINIYSIQ